MQILIPTWRRRLPAAALCALVALAGATHADPPSAASTSQSQGEREAAAKARLAEVRVEIAKIAEAQKATASKRDAIDATLAEQAGQLNEIANAVRDTEAAIAARSASLDDLQQQRAQLEDRLSGQRAALAGLLRATYTLDRGSDLSLLLGDDGIAKIDRALAYSRYFQQDRVARIRALLGQVAQLDQVKAAIEAETAALQQQRAQHNVQSTELEQARAAQQKLLAEADAQLARQKDRIATLRHDAETLNQLLKQLQNVFADIPAQLGKNTPFAQLRGKLAWPVAGKPHNGTGTLAQGIVIAANAGNFRIFGPDETASNRLSAVFDVTDKAWMAEILPVDEHLAHARRRQRLGDEPGGLVVVGDDVDLLPAQLGDDHSHPRAAGADAGADRVDAVGM